MSLCRWSDMDWKCDLYIYENMRRQFIIEVALMRFVGAIPPIIEKNTPQERARVWNDQISAVLGCAREKINLPYAGAEIVCNSLPMLLHVLLTLKDVGYNFPNHVFDFTELAKDAHYYPVSDAAPISKDGRLSGIFILDNLPPSDDASMGGR